MHLFGLNQGYYRSRISIRLLAAGWIAVWVGLFGVVTPSQAQSQFQRLLPDVDKEVADQDRFFWSIEKIPPQPYMCSPSALLRQIEGLSEGRISGSS
jgi:hypothetical protein